MKRLALILLPFVLVACSATGSADLQELLKFGVPYTTDKLVAACQLKDPIGKAECQKLELFAQYCSVNIAQISKEVNMGLEIAAVVVPYLGPAAAINSATIPAQEAFQHAACTQGGFLTPAS